jgi:hypothetical protein
MASCVERIGDTLATRLKTPDSWSRHSMKSAVAAFGVRSITLNNGNIPPCGFEVYFDRYAGLLQAGE